MKTSQLAGTDGAPCSVDIARRLLCKVQHTADGDHRVPGAGEVLTQCARFSPLRRDFAVSREKSDPRAHFGRLGRDFQPTSSGRTPCRRRARSRASSRHCATGQTTAAPIGAASSSLRPTLRGAETPNPRGRTTDEADPVVRCDRLRRAWHPASLADSASIGTGVDRGSMATVD